MIEATHKIVNEPLIVKGNTVTVPHLGISLRAVLGAALNNRANFSGRRVKILYKETVIGELRLKDD